MATWEGSGHGDGRSWNSSPRSKARATDNTKNILCRNVTIYGYCRHEKDGCPYNHGTSKPTGHSSQHSSSSLKRFNVDSPSFTPSLPSDTSASKKPGFSPRAAGATPFTPRGTKSTLAAPSAQPKHQSPPEWPSHEIPEFVPQGFQTNAIVDHGDTSQSLSVSDSFNPYDGANSYSDIDASSATQFNPYAHDASTASAPGGAGHTIYNQQNSFTQPLNYHLYAPSGPYRENLLAYQRTAHDFFINEDLRQSLQRNTEATLQAFPNSSLPPNIEHFHSLVPLDTATQKSTTAFGYNTWLYKAQSSKDGNYYALRRIEGFRLTSEKSVRSVQSWKRIASASCVMIHDCFTTRAFGDSSLIFITDYHPSARTLQDAHLSPNSGANRAMRPHSTTVVPEHVLWGYLVQISSALKSIHSNGLAVRVMNLSKVLITGKNRLRLNGHAILDVIQPTIEGTPLQTLHHDDLAQLGRLLLSLASSTTSPSAFAQGANSTQRALENISRTYGQRFVSTAISLLDAGNPANPKAISDVATLMSQIADYALASFDAALHADDDLTNCLGRELENGRLARLLIKLGFINERPEYNPHEPSSASVNSGAASSTPSQAAMQRGAWSETGDRFYLKLFRDFVFHQVNAADGRPVVDLAHVIACLNKLDAGSEERIALVSRDEQSVIVVSYREVKRGIERAFTELRQAGSAAGQAGSWR